MENGVAVVTLDRPPVNALAMETFDEIHRVLDEIADNPECLILIFTAKGKGFCAGVDIKIMLEADLRWSGNILTRS